MTNRVKSQRLLMALSMLVGLIIVLGLVIVPLEQTGNPQTNFGGPGDGLWWAVTTATGVGYGDLVPVTTAGRLVGVALETIGVTTFGLVIAFITINLLRREQQYYWSRQTERFDRLEKQLEGMKTQLKYSIDERANKTESR